MKRCKLAMSVFFVLAILTGNVCFGGDVPDKELYKISIDFSVATLDDGKDTLEQLRKDGWKIQVRSFDKSKNEILDEIICNQQLGKELLAY